MLAVTSLDDFSTSGARRRPRDRAPRARLGPARACCVVVRGRGSPTRIDAIDQRDRRGRPIGSREAPALADAGDHLGLVVLIYSITARARAAALRRAARRPGRAGHGAGVALGFGAQRIVQDILAGFFIIAERQYGFGDLVPRRRTSARPTGVTGTVEDVTLRITRMRTVNGEVVFLPNGQITQVTNLSRDWARAVVDVPLPATVDIERGQRRAAARRRARLADDATCARCCSTRRR